MHGFSLDRNHVWSIVLAGGEGKRLSPFVRRWLGRHRPKQYCTFVGSRSLFQHTIDRADIVTAPERRVTIAARRHRPEMLIQMGDRSLGELIFQPDDHGTAAGLFLALSYIRDRESDATVIVYPSDHFVFPENMFVAAVSKAVVAAKELPGRLILLGVAPEGPESDYGWIQPGATRGVKGGHFLRHINQFAEKPRHEEAKRLMAEGGLWNTLVMIGKVETLWNLGGQVMPELMFLFEWLRRVKNTSREGEVLDTIYRIMPSRDISLHLLQSIQERLLVMELRELLWSDWGRPQRIVDTLRRIGKQPAFGRVNIQGSFLEHE